jgi:RimJ/RimL family protein N-acetyltransferase
MLHRSIGGRDMEETKISLRQDLEDGRAAVKGGDGLVYRIRPIRLADAPSLQRGYAAMPSEAKLHRMLYKVPELTPQMATRYCSPDPASEYCVVLEGRDALAGEILGGARITYVASGKTAQFTVSLRPEAHGKGLGREAVRTILGVAREMGMGSVWGLIANDNEAMLGLARSLGFALRPNPDESSEILARIELRPGG